MSARWLGAAVLTAAVVGLLAIAATERPPQNRLREVYTPTYQHVPPAPPVRATLAHLWRDLHGRGGQAFLRRLVPDQAGVLWLSAIVALLVAFDFDDLSGPRNIDLIAIQLTGLVLFDIIRFLRLLQDSVYVALMDWVFTALVALNVFLIARALWRVRHPESKPWTPTLSRRALMCVALLLVGCDMLAALVREPDDVGFFVNLGAQRLRERGRLPYGDPLLTGSPGAAYGPLLYVAHLPFQLALAPHPVNVESPDRPALGIESTYNLPPPLATKLCTIAFQLIGVAALWMIGARLRDERTAWALVALYAGSAFVIGIGGDEYFIGGMTYVSHIAPTAMTLLAFALLPSPALAGVALALAAGVGFYPAFMAPAWLGHYWQDRAQRWKFAAGFTIVAAAMGIGVLLLSRSDPGRSLVGTILWDTFGHHTDPQHYGFSPYGFWGQRQGIRGWFNHPLAGSSNFLTPLFLTLISATIGAFWLARRTKAWQLALITGVIAIAASLQKIHPTGTYVAWAYPFLLLGFFADAPASAARRSEAVAHDESHQRERSFGLSVGAALGAIAALLAWRGRVARAEVVGAISAVLLIAGLLQPAVLRRPSQWWWRFSHALGAFNARVMLTVLYGIAFVPIGFFWRMTGKDPLARRRDKWPGWTPHPSRYRDPKHYERMY